MRTFGESGADFVVPLARKSFADRVFNSAQSFCYKQFHYSEHTQKTFGDSGAGVIVDSGIGNTFRNKHVDSDGISADDGMLKTLKGEKEITGDGASHNT